MADLSGEHLIEIRIGSGEPQSMRVKPNEPMGPTLIGTTGAWRLDAPGVVAEHAEIYFDGGQLFVRSVSPGAPVLVAGRPVPGVWTPLAPPCEIMVGTGRLWFGPDLAAPARVAREELLEDDDNVATKVADQKDQPWGDAGALVQRGIDASRSQAGALRPLPPPEPPPPPPPNLFWPPPPPGEDPTVRQEPGTIELPSKTRRKDDSGVTRIEPPEDVARRRELTASGSNYPRVGGPGTSGIHLPPPAASSAPGVLDAPPPSGDGRATYNDLGGYGGTAVLPNSPLPSPALGATRELGASPAASLSRSAPFANPAATGFPTFGPPPSAPPSGPQAPGPPPSFGGLPVPVDSGFARVTGTHPQVAPPIGLTAPRMEQPISVEGLERAEPGGKKSAWQELSGPKKALVFLSPLLVAAVLVLFMGEELGITPASAPPPPPRASASSKPPVPQATAATAAPEPEPTAMAGPPPSGSPPPPSSSAAAPPPPRPVATQPPRSPSQRPEPSTLKGASGKTLQREAADAVASGAYARAAELYERLAKEHPDKPEYSEAAAILRAKGGQR